MTIGLPEMTLWIGTAVVGFGFAACTQPHDAQEPHAITAAESAAISLTLFTNGLPPGMQNVPSLPSGGLPSTARM